MATNHRAYITCPGPMLTSSCFTINIVDLLDGNVAMDVTIEHASTVDQTISCTVQGDISAHNESIQATVLAGNTTASGYSMMGAYSPGETFSITNESIFPGQDSTYTYVFC